MIYLDYAANTPVDELVLSTYCEVSRDYPANPNSPHALGKKAKECLDGCTNQIASLLNVRPDEIIYTSGASESNNLAIKGAARQYRARGRHIITTYLEHSSVNGAVMYLQSQGYEIDYVDLTPDGLVDLESLKGLMRDDTVLVSICYVDSEVGIRQRIGEIAQLLAGYPNCLFHVDATQAVGKIPLDFSGVDLVTFAPHKFYGPNGCGVLIKKAPVLLEPLIHGGISTTPFRSGTPALPLIAASAKALELACGGLAENCDYVSGLNAKLREALSQNRAVKINSTKESVPFILNLSILGAKSEDFQEYLSQNDIFLSTKSACCAPGTVSRPVYAVTGDRRAALSTLRVSLSHLTTQDEVEKFLACFDECCRRFVKGN